MKAMKRLLPMLVAVALSMVAFSGLAFAAEHTVSTESTTHTYQIYQVFTGTVSEGQLTNLKYGANAVGTPGEAVSQTDMTTLATIEGKTYADDQAKITDLLPFVNLDSTAIAEIGKGKESSASLAEGYYIIKDTDDSLQDPETYTLYLFKVLDGDLTITPKSGTTTSDKNIAETTPTNTGDYDIGSVIPYSLTLTLPENYADFKDYYAKFVDDMSGGLTLNADSVKIHYGASDTEGTSITLSAVSGTSYTDPAGQKYEYEITDLKQVAAAANLGAGDTVTITYTATLNSNAVVGEAGNPNKFHVVYSNNPNETGSGNTNETPDDTNIVFTFETIFNKVDGDKKPLTGADFKLEKKVGDSWVDVTTLNSENGSSPIKTGSTTTTSGQFTFSGLGQGQYRLTETTTPTGYNPITPIEFTITAEYEIVNNDSGSITSLTGTDGGSFTMTSNTATGTLTADIVNQSGATLPSTGGMGTTILYIIGGALVLVAGAALIARRVARKQS
jgi:fimbrial isopeptide formation D2 family protein/LPXTG-motif cell wall-anchored protein